MVTDAQIAEAFVDGYRDVRIIAASEMPAELGIPVGERNLYAVSLTEHPALGPVTVYLPLCSPEYMTDDYPAEIRRHADDAVARRIAAEGVRDG